MGGWRRRGWGWATGVLLTVLVPAWEALGASLVEAGTLGFRTDGAPVTTARPGLSRLAAVLPCWPASAGSYPACALVAARRVAVLYRSGATSSPPPP